MSEHPIVTCYRGLDSADAVQLGAQLAAVLKEPLVLGCSYRYEPAAYSARAQPAPDNERRAEATQIALRRARSFVPRDVVVSESVIPATDVVAGLIDLACDVDASVLVLGRDTDGHVTRSLVPRAPCPVAVAPSSVPLPLPGPITRIGVAFDGSPQARWALLAATRLARAAGATLLILTVAATTDRARASLRIARLLLDREPQSFETRAVVGDPSTTLAGASAELDMLVCGSRGRGRPLAAILGSVSTHLIGHAHCPVLVVPPSVAGHRSTALGVTSAAASA
jgi:nucleotide-binding universal stress UspA family protein